MDNSNKLVQNALHLIKKEPFFLLRKKRSLHFAKTKIPLPKAPPIQIPSPIAPVQEEKKAPPPLPAPKPVLKEIKLEKVQPLSHQHVQSVKKHLQAIDPTLVLLNDPLPDHVAKTRQLKNTRLYNIALLVFEKDPKKLAFLQNITKVLTHEFMPAKLCNAASYEKENRWEEFLSSTHLKLVIATDHEIFHAQNLMKHYKELPNQAKRMLKDIALFLLPDLNLYFKQPNLKRSLYKALCHKIQTL